MYLCYIYIYKLLYLVDFAAYKLYGRRRARDLTCAAFVQIIIWSAVIMVGVVLSPSLPSLFRLPRRHRGRHIALYCVYGIEIRLNSSFFLSVFDWMCAFIFRFDFICLFVVYVFCVVFCVVDELIQFAIIWFIHTHQRRVKRKRERTFYMNRCHDYIWLLV